MFICHAVNSVFHKTAKYMRFECGVKFYPIILHNRFLYNRLKKQATSRPMGCKLPIQIKIFKKHYNKKYMQIKDDLTWRQARKTFGCDRWRPDCCWLPPRWSGSLEIIRLREIAEPVIARSFWRAFFQRSADLMSTPCPERWVQQPFWSYVIVPR
jgi:hypothetical protein